MEALLALTMAVGLSGAARAQGIAGSKATPAGVSSPARPAAALAGRWIAEPMTIEWTVEFWGSSCGARPAGRIGSGGPVEVTESDGELRFVGTGFSTRSCWGDHAGLTRTSHSIGASTWRSTCESPKEQVRRERLDTVVRASAHEIRLREIADIQFMAAGQMCSAQGRWLQVFRRPGPPLLAEGEGGDSAADRAEPSAQPPAPLRRPPPRPCARPGPPASLELTPGSKLMRAGEQYRFSAFVRDRRGCPLRGAVRWSIEPPSVGSSLRQDGTLRVASDAVDANFRVEARAGGEVVRAEVLVVSRERYRRLLETGIYTDAGAGPGSEVAQVNAATLGTQHGRSRLDPEGRKWTFVALVGGIALLLLAVGTTLLRAARRSPREAARRLAVADTVRSPDREVPASAVEADVGADSPPESDCLRVCPLCGTIYYDPVLEACPQDGGQLRAVNA